MSRAAKITLGVIIVCTSVLIGWDIVVATNDESGDTISELMLAASYRYPGLGLAWGGLAGHLFWPRDSPLFWRKPHTAFLLGGVCLALIAVGLFVSLWVLPIGPLLVGIPLGHWLWPQKPRVAN